MDDSRDDKFLIVRTKLESLESGYSFSSGDDNSTTHRCQFWNISEHAADNSFPRLIGHVQFHLLINSQQEDNLQPEDSAIFSAERSVDLDRGASLANQTI